MPLNKPGPGRPRGSRNKSTIVREEVARETAKRLSNQDLSMLDIVQIIARDAFNAGDFSIALAAAEKALPYVAPRMAPVAGPDPNKASVSEILLDQDPDIMEDRYAPPPAMDDAPQGGAPAVARTARPWP